MHKQEQGDSQQHGKTPEERLKDIEDAKAALRTRVALRKAASQASVAIVMNIYEVLHIYNICLEV